MGRHLGLQHPGWGPPAGEEKSNFGIVTASQPESDCGDLGRSEAVPEAQKNYR